MAASHPISAASGKVVSLPQADARASKVPCRLCQCQITGATASDQLCAECQRRPEARLLGPVPSGAMQGAPRHFTRTERGLIEQLSESITPQKLLQVLNDRLKADLGPDVLLYTLNHLASERPDASGDVPSAGDWAGLRKLLSKAGRAGLLDQVNRQMIDDFAVVFSLSPAQVLRLKDVLLQNRQGGRT